MKAKNWIELTRDTYQAEITKMVHRHRESGVTCNTDRMESSMTTLQKKVQTSSDYFKQHELLQ